MEQTHESTSVRGVILALAVCLFVLLLYQAGKLWLADHYVRSNTLTKLERGDMRSWGHFDVTMEPMYASVGKWTLGCGTRCWHLYTYRNEKLVHFRSEDWGFSAGL